MSRKTVEKNIAYDDIKKKYYVTFNYGVDSDGKQIKKSRTYSNRTEAKKALKEHEADKAKGLLIAPKDTTLLEWLNYWINDIVIPSRAETTVYGYKNIIDKHISPELGQIPLQQLKPQQVQRYYANLLNVKGLSTNTIRKHHDLLRAALQVAVKQDMLLKNPIDRVEAPKLINSDINFYTSEDLRKLLAIVEGDRLEVVVYLAGYLGLRREEICGLKWENVDFEKGTIFIKDARTMAGGKVIEKGTKNYSSTRVVSLSEEIIGVLQKEKVKQEEAKDFYQDDYIDYGLVVVKDNGKPYRPNYISELFTKFISDNNLPQITLHGLRHTFASVANSLGIPMFEIGKALGHSTPSTTGKIYTHLFDPIQKGTFQKISNEININGTNPT